MADQGPQSNSFKNLMKRIASIKPVTWVYSKTLHHFDSTVLRMSGGQATLTSVLTGLPIVTLTAKGVKSGQPRSVPLIGIPDGDKVVLIATNWGQKSYPSWYFNLRACPEATVTLKGETRILIAREADPAERERYWPLAVKYYPGYDRYKERIGDSRKIPIMVLEPKPPFSQN